MNKIGVIGLDWDSAAVLHCYAARVQSHLAAITGTVGRCGQRPAGAGSSSTGRTQE